MAKDKKILAGIDISAETLNVALLSDDGAPRDLVFANDADGHRQLVAALTKRGHRARVVCEATGLYGLDLCLALDDAHVEVMVANPKAAKRFMEAQMRRAKTDKVDARALLEFVTRMEFVAWTRPSPTRLAIRLYSRRIADLTKLKTAERNRRHALGVTGAAPKALLDDLDKGIASLDSRIDELETQALALLAADPELAKSADVIQTIKGIKGRATVALLGELLLLPADMTPRQVVAHAGLDPRPRETGGPQQGKRHISKIGDASLRAALYFPALTAGQHEPAVKAFRDRLVARGKPPMVAVTAIARRLLQCIWRMLQTQSPWDPAKFSPKPSASPVALPT